MSPPPPPDKHYCPMIQASSSGLTQSPRTTTVPASHGYATASAFFTTQPPRHSTPPQPMIQASPQLTQSPRTTTVPALAPPSSVPPHLLHGNAMASAFFTTQPPRQYCTPPQPRSSRNQRPHLYNDSPHQLQGFPPCFHVPPPVNMVSEYGYGYCQPLEPYYPDFPGAYYPLPFPPMPFAPPLRPYTAPLVAPNFLGVAPLVRHFDSEEEKLRRQIEYYFSDENLEHDIYLKKQMDSEGWVRISEIAKFNRVKRLTNDINLIKEALSTSRHVEVRDDKMRKRWGWNRWILPQVEA